jgi:hypothetical protein
VRLVHHIAACSLAVAAVWLLAMPSVAADDPPTPAPTPTPEPPAPTLPDRDSDAWRAEFDMLGWLLGVDGTVGARGYTAASHATFLDIVDAADSLFAFTGRLELGKGRLGAYIDGTYDKVGVDGATDPSGVADVDVDFSQTTLDFGAMFRILEPDDTLRDPTLDLYAGGRYMGVSLDLDPANIPAISGDRSWTDPICGAKLGLPLTDRFRLALNGDVGGFGASSDFTWSATALVVYDFTVWSKPASLMLGYRGIGWNHVEGTGDQRFTWDVIEHGVIVGFGLRF